MTPPLVRVYTAFWYLVVIVTAVPMALHELVHAAVAAPRAERVIVEMDGLGATTKIKWRPGTSYYWSVASALAPFGIGMLVGGVSLYFAWSTGMEPPESLVKQMAVFSIGAWWLIFTSPLQDLAVFR